ncbi:hypothetical protein [Bartonella doshiae]|uniref:Uncharacterized protein n=2 Tax=Bartonella doshiae TaxID=33044 RepID=A0A380ZG12_BARDO|nr:hypothetical protein [Bartonella doshiae]EJF81126.1 hypothetical protein MCS_00839 [Bartonella doshiae NCTC 12862 = ATCC 700133]MBB6159164.1 hypothetical protein [Bartonella doshiae]SUV45274.1 Uncharacterised protein [Bartonella doshiae]
MIVVNKIFLFLKEVNKIILENSHVFPLDEKYNAFLLIFHFRKNLVTDFFKFLFYNFSIYLPSFKYLYFIVEMKSKEMVIVLKAGYVRKCFKKGKKIISVVYFCQKIVAKDMYKCANAHVLLAQSRSSEYEAT